MSRTVPLAILLVSLLLRVVLAAQGGQYFFGDEERYDRGIDLYRAIAVGDTHGVAAVVAKPEHALFPWVGALVTAAQHGLAHFTPFGEWSHPEHTGFTIWIGAAVLSLFSTLNLFLVYRLARKSGADDEEATWALLLMAVSNTSFYYARHLLPYDCALSAGLAALVVGLGTPTLLRATVAGLLTGITYHLYNGYWFLVPVVALVLGLVWRSAPQRGRLIVGLVAGSGLALALPVALGATVGGAAYWTTLRAFSHSVTQGLFAEGWSLPWEYLWHSEGGLGVVVGVAVIAWIALALRQREPLPDRIRGTLIALGVAYGLLVLGSCGLGRFVVYGRTVKPLVPALCLLGGWATRRGVEQFPRGRPLVAAGIFAVGALNFWPHFGRVFPRETEVAVLRAWGNPKRALTVAGSVYIPLTLPVTRPDLALIDAQPLYPVRAPLAAPTGVTLLRLEHPLSYPPFQYEGHSPRERAILRSTDISMRLVRLTTPGDVPDHPPPAVRFGDTDRATGH